MSEDNIKKGLMKGSNMAGYIFNIGKEIKVLDIIKQGYYSPLMSDSLSPNPFEGTFGDFVTMKEGDNVYFFQNRKIYGVGKLYKIGDDCKYNNFIGATSLEQFSYNEINSLFSLSFSIVILIPPVIFL